MRTLILCFTLMVMAVGTFTVSAVNPEPTDTVTEKVHGPKIRLGDKEINLGLFAEGEKAEGSIKFYNDGDQPLVINQIFTDCRCTSPEYTKEAVAPGESGEIKISFNSKGMAPGSFTKVVRIRSNALNAKEVLFVKGKIKRPYRK